MSDVSAGAVRRGSRGPVPSATASLRAVAQAAGVSPATVSRVFSGKADVTEPTRTKVLQTARDLGYVVNGLARTMMGTAPRHLGLVTSMPDGPSNSAFIAGVTEVAARTGHLTILVPTDGDPAREAAAIEALCEQRVAGVVLGGPGQVDPQAQGLLTGYAAMLRGVGGRLVLAGRTTAVGPGMLSVGYDQIGGMRQAVAYLAARGHHRIAFLGWAKSTTTGQRFLGYSLELTNAGLAMDSSLVVECAADPIQAHLATLLLMRRADPPTAIVCTADPVAIGVCRAARDLGIAVPTELAVIGFEDWPCAAELTPPLASVAVPFADLGRRAAELALDCADGTEWADLPTTLTVRESAG